MAIIRRGRCNNYKMRQILFSVFFLMSSLEMSSPANCLSLSSDEPLIAANQTVIQMVIMTSRKQSTWSKHSKIKSSNPVLKVTSAYMVTQETKHFPIIEFELLESNCFFFEQVPILVGATRVAYYICVIHWSADAQSASQDRKRRVIVKSASHLQLGNKMDKKEQGDEE